MGKKYDGARAASASSIEIDFYFGGERFKERVKLIPSPANLKRAANHRAAILDAIARGTFDYSKTFPNSKRAKDFSRPATSAVLNIERYIDTWLQHKKPTIKSSTYMGYAKIIRNQIIPKFGSMALADLKRHEIRAWIATCGARNKTISNMLSILRSALDDAMMDELIDVNPLAGWSYKRSELPSEDKKPDPLTSAEQAALLSATTGAYRNQLQFSIWTGIRPSELAALDWADVDFVNGFVRISKAKTQESKIIESTKTASSVRDIRLLAPAMAALLAQKEHTFLKGVEVFTNPNTGARWHGAASIRDNVWIPAIRRSGVRYRKPYQTRHTYGSMMVSAGENPAWVAAQMGHSDWGMIRRVYAQWMPSENDSAGIMAEKMFALKKVV